MKKKIDKTKKSVKVGRAFELALEALRAAYREELERRLGELLPRIQAGEFADLGDEPSDGEDGDPGIGMLENAVAELPVCRGERTARLIGCASVYAYLESSDLYGQEDTMIAAYCLARDLRDLYRRRFGEGAVATLRRRFTVAHNVIQLRVGDRVSP